MNQLHNENAWISLAIKICDSMTELFKKKNDSESQNKVIEIELLKKKYLSEDKLAKKAEISKRDPLVLASAAREESISVAKNKIKDVKLKDSIITAGSNQIWSVSHKISDNLDQIPKIKPIKDKS